MRRDEFVRTNLRSRVTCFSLTACVVWLLAASATLCGAAGLELYVARNGSDAWSGRAPDPNKMGTDGPFASLERARDEIRKLKAADGLPKGGVVVFLRGGSHIRRAPFVLRKADSGTPEAPVVYRAFRRETARVTGGRPIGGFRKVADADVLARLDPAARPHVVATHLPMQGLSDYGVIGVRRHQEPSAGLDLFFRDKPMTLARWPNKGYARVAGAPEGQKGGVFAYEADRPSRWTREADPRACGYWAHDWAASNVAFRSIDTQNKTIATRPPHAAYGYRTGKRFFGYNLLCELDEPGEWYLDRVRGILYFWPPERITPGSVVVSVCPNLVQTLDTSHVTLRGLTLEACRGTAVLVRGGEGVGVVGCTIRNVGVRAVILAGGTGHRVVGCDISDTGEGGIRCVGGDKKTLTPCRFLIENNVITRCSRWQRTHTNAVVLYTTGARVAHNLMYDFPHHAITFTGNDNVLEFNEVHSIGYEAGELGAFYAGRDWTLCGNVIRHNYFHDIYNPCPQRNRAIMLDDGAAGMRIEGNLFVRVAEGISLSSLNNHVLNNIFVHCRPAIGCWGGRTRFPAFDPTHGHNKVMWPRLVGLPLDQAPWSTRYPILATLRNAIRNAGPVAPELRARIERNIFHDTAEDIGFNHTPTPHCWQIAHNLRGQDPQFVDPAHDDYRLRPTSPALKLGFKPIPIAKTGPYNDPSRASWPIRHAVRTEMTRDLTFVPPSRKRKGGPPVFRAPRTPGAVTIDGVIAPNEWRGADPAKAMVLREDVQGGISRRVSHAWLAWDTAAPGGGASLPVAGKLGTGVPPAAALYVAVRNHVSAKPALKIGSKWGTDDAVELALRNPAAGNAAPILVLRGFASGAFESSTEAGATAAQAAQAAAGVQHAAKVVSPTQWDAEWRIPFASLGIDPTRHTKLAFNVTVRKTADGLWLMWVGTGAQSWKVGQAGVLELVP